MGKGYILTVDQGTSATKAILFDEAGRLIRRSNTQHGQFYPKPGWVEHDPEEIYQNTLLAIKTVLEESGIPEKAVAVLSITNQRETAVVWDRKTGKPIYNAIVWQCQRGGEICKKLIEQGHGPKVTKKTGLVLAPYFSATKIQWILDHVDGAREKAEAGELLCGNMDAWLVWKLTEGRVHATDYSNASRTQLFNIRTLQWDDELLELFHIPKNMLPAVQSSNRVFGHTRAEGIFSAEIPISGIMGDSHAALFGQCCFEKGMAKATYGTGSSIMMNIGESLLYSQNGIVSSIAWGYNDKVDYVFEGNINCTGATIKWLVDDLEMIPDAKTAGKLAATLTSNEGVYLVPAFVGLSAPYWNSEAKATITGMTRGTKKAHIVRAAEESIAYQIKDIMDLMIRESETKLKELRVDGGPTRDSFLMQFQADMLDVPVVCSTIEELSAIGSAFMAGLYAGFWSSREEIETLRVPDRTFCSSMKALERNTLYGGWKKAVQTTLFESRSGD